MPSSLPALSAETPLQPSSARHTLVGLQETLSRIANLNADPALHHLIAESLVGCGQIAAFFDTQFANVTGQEETVDVQVFERLMRLAGEDTALELLDQLLQDLNAAETAISAAAPILNWPVLRMQCHMLIAVAGSVGATAVLRDAEHLQAATRQADAFAAKRLAEHLLVHLQKLITFVQAERRARTIV